MGYDQNEIDDFDEFEKIVVDMLYPPNFINIFPTMDSFRDWVSLGGKEDIEIILKLYEFHELYEHCVIIKEELNKK